MNRYILLILLFVLFLNNSYSQDPERYRVETDTLLKKCINKSGTPELYLFTGSSTIRRWNNLNVYFPEYNIVNTGFGGSHMSDLLYYYEKLIVKFKPVKVFIYEGDNDIFAGKSPELIVAQADSLVKMIHNKLPGTKMVFITPKPSPSRWQLREQYLSLNRHLAALSRKYDFVSTADIWNTFLDTGGRPEGKLFISDSLHINDLGYRILAGRLKSEF